MDWGTTGKRFDKALKWGCGTLIFISAMLTLLAAFMLWRGCS